MVPNMKMSPDAIPNNISLAKDTQKSIDEAPVLAWEHLFVPRPESEGGRQKIKHENVSLYYS